MKWFAALLFIALPASAQNPPLENLHGFGCDTKLIEGQYRLTGWAWHGHADGEKLCGSGRDWCIELSRDPSVDRTVKRCLKWYHKVEKATKKAQPK